MAALASASPASPTASAAAWQVRPIRLPTTVWAASCDTAGSGNTIRRNSIFANGTTHAGPGIVLRPGSNNDVGAPSLQRALLSGTTLFVKGSFFARVANVPYVYWNSLPIQRVIAREWSTWARWRWDTLKERNSGLYLQHDDYGDWSESHHHSYLDRWCRKHLYLLKWRNVV